MQKNFSSDEFHDLKEFLTVNGISPSTTVVTITKKGHYIGNFYKASNGNFYEEKIQEVDQGLIIALFQLESEDEYVKTLTQIIQMA